MSALVCALFPFNLTDESKIRMRRHMLLTKAFIITGKLDLL